DTDFDGVLDGIEAPALSAFQDLDGNGFVDRFNPDLVDYTMDFITDPTNPDTDGDGLARWIYRGPNDDTKGLKDDYIEIFGDGMSPAPNPPGNLIPGVHVGGHYRVQPHYTGGAIFQTRT